MNELVNDASLESEQDAEQAERARIDTENIRFKALTLLMSNGVRAHNSYMRNFGSITALSNATYQEATKPSGVGPAMLALWSAVSEYLGVVPQWSRGLGERNIRYRDMLAEYRERLAAFRPNDEERVESDDEDGVELIAVTQRANLGMASTYELISEIKRRGEMSQLVYEEGTELRMDCIMLAATMKFLLSGMPDQILDYRTVASDE